MNTLPFFVWSVHDLHKIPNFVRGYLKYQQYYFVPFFLLLRLIWIVQCVMYVALDLPKNPNKFYRSIARAEQVTLAIHWVWYFSLLYFASNHLLFFAISELLPGFGIAIIVFFNHYACYHYKDTKEQFDFVDLVCMTTRDMTPGVVTDWICGGLNYQIEHHMFPTMPRHNMSIAAKYTKQFCQEQNLEYQCTDFPTGFRDLLQQLSNVSNQLEKMKMLNSFLFISKEEAILKPDKLCFLVVVI